MKLRDAALATKHEHFSSQEIFEDYLPTHEYIQQVNGLSDREPAITTGNTDFNWAAHDDDIEKHAASKQLEHLEFLNIHFFGSMLAQSSHECILKE